MRNNGLGPALQGLGGLRFPGLQIEAEEDDDVQSKHVCGCIVPGCKVLEKAKWAEVRREREGGEIGSIE